MRVYCGLASAEQRIPVAVVDDAGRLLASHEVDDSPLGYADVCTLVSERCAVTGQVRGSIATDTETSLIALLLAAAGEPLAVGNTEVIEQFISDEPVGAPEPHRRAVALARALQAGVLAASAQPVPRDLAALRPVLTAHRAAIVGRSASVAMLRELLRELYPAALYTFPDPSTSLALSVLEQLPDPVQAGRHENNDVVERLASAGFTEAEIAVEALRHAAVEMSNGSTADAVATAVRHGVSSVRSVESTAASLLNAIAGKVEPRTGGQSFSAAPEDGASVARTPVPEGRAPSRAPDGTGLPELPAAPPAAAPAAQPALEPPPTGDVSPDPGFATPQQPLQPPGVPELPGHAYDAAPAVPSQRNASDPVQTTGRQPAGGPYEQGHPRQPPPAPARSAPSTDTPPDRPTDGSPYSSPPATNGYHSGAFPLVIGQNPYTDGAAPATFPSPEDAYARSPVPDTGPPVVGSAAPAHAPTEDLSTDPVNAGSAMPAGPAGRTSPADEDVPGRPSRSRSTGGRLAALIEFPRFARRHTQSGNSASQGEETRRSTKDEPTQEYRPPSPRRQSSAESPTSAPSVSDGDGDLLIFAEARSAWFSDDEADGPPAEWRSEADAGWTAAEAASSPTVGGTTRSGLPRRVPSANLVPGTAPNRDSHVHPANRDAAQLAAHTAGYFQGWYRARKDGPDQQEPPPPAWQW